MLRRLVFLVLVAMLLWPVAAYAQDSDSNDDDDVLVRVNGPITIAAGESVDVLVVVNDNAIVDGTVTDTLVVVNGTATINGQVGENVVVARGDLVLGPTAVVEDVHLYQSDIVRDPAATVNGDIDESAEFNWSWWDSAIFSFAIWIGMTIVVLVAAFLFAFFGGRQLLALGATARTNIAMNILTAIVLFIGLPILAIGAFLSIIGIPLGLAILLVLIPLLWFLGYIVIGAQLGLWLRSKMGSTSDGSGIVLATLIGVLVLQIISLIPFIGGFIAFLAGLYGAGVLVYHLIKRRGNRPGPAVADAGTAAPLSTS